MEKKIRCSYALDLENQVWHERDGRVAPESGGRAAVLCPSSLARTEGDVVLSTSRPAPHVRQRRPIASLEVVRREIFSALKNKPTRKHQDKS